MVLKKQNMLLKKTSVNIDPAIWDKLRAQAAMGKLTLSEMLTALINANENINWYKEFKSKKIK